MKYELNVVVNGKQIDKYIQGGDIYVEGRRGNEYKIQLKNNTSQEALFVVSVDGLSIMDGKPASKDSNGYVVRAWQTLDVDGWMVDHDTVAKFKFGSKESSYTNVIGEGVDNTGVIGLQVFEKKITLPPILIKHEYYPKTPIWPYIVPRYIDYDLDYTGYPSWTYTFGGASGAIGSGSLSSSVGQSSNSVKLSAKRSVEPEVEQKTKGGIIGASLNQMYLSTTSSTSGPDLSSFEHPEEISSLATEFGDASDFKTYEINFERASEVAAYQTALFYASAGELNKLGIRLNWQKTTVKKPQAFPGDFCKKPAGWGKD